MRIESSSEPVQPVFTIVVIGIQMMEQMMVAQEPGEPVIVPYHTTCIKKEKDKENIIQRIGNKEHGHHGTHALKG
jgi:hypothetical protein